MTQAVQSSNARTAVEGGHSSSAPLPDFTSGGDVGANPTLTETDVINGIMGTGPNYTYNANGVPIGAGIGFTVTGQGTNVTLASATWTGGTTYTSYFGSSATTVPATSMTIGQQPAKVVDNNLATNTDGYAFIVDNKPRAYTVSVTVTYKDPVTGAAVGGGPFTASVTLTSFGPTGSLAKLNQDSPMWFPNGTAPPGKTPASVIAYQQNNMGPGMQIQATVTASPNFAGNFMFTQIITPQRTLSAVTGGTVNFSGNGKLNYDDGTFLVYGFPLDGGGNSWFVPANFKAANPGQNILNSMSDTPFISATTANTPLQLSVGSIATVNGKPVLTPEKFSTYLMWQNTVEGVWVAIAELDWSWALGYSRPNSTSPWVNTIPSSSPAPVNSNPPPIGPTWVARFSQGTYA